MNKKTWIVLAVIVVIVVVIVLLTKKSSTVVVAQPTPTNPVSSLLNALGIKF